jgi:SAM-dependent methyltransferase
VTREDYREALDRAVAFTGTSHELFARAKALELVRLAKFHLGDPARLDALDAGCGIGLVDQHLRGRFRSLAGTDISADDLATAARENPGVSYQLAQPGRLPFEDDSFDLTFAANVVQVVATGERPQFLAEVGRVTRRGGLVVVFEHNPYNPLTRLVVRRFSLSSDVRMLQRRRTVELVTSAGMARVTWGYMLVFPSRRARVLALERALRRLPLGAQYYVAARPR